MKLFGITGGVGMGKSTAGELLRARGLTIIDTDDIARDVVEPGQPALEQISNRFGATLLGPEGRLNRAELARIVFSNDEARKDLESILHPRIRDAWMKHAETWRAEGRSIGFVVIPLLFETNSAEHFSSIVCVACKESSQRERLRGRGWSDFQITQRLRAQMPVSKKMELSDFVIWTETTPTIHAEQWDYLLGHHLK